MTENTTKNKGGRPNTELTHEQIQEVEKLAGSLNIKQIADYLDISVATFHRLKAKDSEVIKQSQPIYPTQYKNRNSGAILPVEDNKTWIYFDEETQ